MSSLSCGIVGLPNVGKSTLFNALTRLEAPASNFPFCTIDPNVGVVEVSDARLNILGKLSKSAKIIPTAMRFVDIAGLVEGASKGEGLGNQFLGNIRETDAIIHVVRCFEDPDVVHVSGSVDPIRDIELIHLELVLADLQMVENALSRLERRSKADKELLPTVEILKRVKGHLDGNFPVRTLEMNSAEQDLLKQYSFLTNKAVLYACNVHEDELPEMENEYVAKVRSYAEEHGDESMSICAKIEQEIAQLEDAEQREFLESLGLEESGLDRLIHRAFDLLGLLTFLTTGEKETRAWTITKGMTAPQGAGKIHTDIQKGFIRAEIVSYDDLVAAQSWARARDEGKLRVEGKSYVMQDGDVVLFLHS